jgi:hypothetical protein
MFHHEITLRLTPEQAQAVSTAIDYYILWLEQHPGQNHLREDKQPLEEVQTQMKQEAVQPHSIGNGNWTATNENHTEYHIS